MIVPLFGNAAEDEKRAFEIADYYRTAFVGSPVTSPDGETDRVPGHPLRPRGGGELERDLDDAGGRIRVAADDAGPAPRWFAGLFSGRQTAAVRFGPRRRVAAVLDAGRRRGGPATHRLSVWVFPVRCGRPTGSGSPFSPRSTPSAAPTPSATRPSPMRWRPGRSTCVRLTNCSTATGPGGERGAMPMFLLVEAESGKVVRDLTPGRWDSPTFSVGGGGGFAFSPDGRELCVVSNHDPDQARSTNSDLWVVPVDTEAVDPAAVNITRTNGGWDGDPGLFARRALHRLPEPGRRRATSPTTTGSGCTTGERKRRAI